PRLAALAQAPRRERWHDAEFRYTKGAAMSRGARPAKLVAACRFDQPADTLAGSPSTSTGDA
ncbi:hypothetical protein, partial [Mesorhizobium intechi]|uniref:hypothetical protein n=1 Tax=Mesorhizobium intechi TaxID=537601 RepID=UPI001ABFDB34